MENFNPNDDQLISYLIGDLDQMESEKIKHWLSLDESNRSRLMFLSLLRDEVKSTPFVLRKKTASFTMLFMRMGALMIFLLIGIWMQAKWDILAIGESVEPSLLSEPLSWDNNFDGKFL